MFSRRSAWAIDDSPWQRALARWRQAGQAHPCGPPLDLSESNPTRTSLAVGTDVLGLLSNVDARRYEPESCGLAPARQAIVRYYRERGHPVDADHVLLAAGTSELYFHLLQLACDPGDTVLVPTPGYPLLEVLAELAGVALQTYPTLYDGQWYLDQAGLQATIDQVKASGRRVGAIVAVSPNNPTGHILAPCERTTLLAVCAALPALLIVDEVFADYRLQAQPAAFSCLSHGADAGAQSALGFVLSGLSKVALLPQVKLAWAAGFGPTSALHVAFERLAISADAFLSAATPVQLAVDHLLQASAPARADLLSRLQDNLAQAKTLLAATPIDVLHVAGGWSLILRLPFLVDEEAWSLDLLQRANILVSPGELYGLRSNEVVLSLLCEPKCWQLGLERLRQRVSERLTNSF